MKKRKKFSVILPMIAIILSLSIFASAAVIGVDPSTNVQRMFDVPNETINGTTYSALQSIAIRKTTQCMYVAKCDTETNSCAIYYYPNLNTPSNYKVVRINDSGHANGGSMYVGANVGYTVGAQNDGIFKITHTVGSNTLADFVLS